MTEFETIRIVEIGAAGYFKEAFPKQTRFFHTGGREPRRDGGSDQKDPQSLAELMRVLGSDDCDLIVCTPSPRAPWHWQTLSRLLFNRRVVSNLRRPLRHFGPQLLRFYRGIPLAVVDFEDTPFIDRDNFFLMDRARLYFKRELPADEWRLLTKTATATQPSARFRRSRRAGERLAKVRPLSLGLPRGSEADLPSDLPPKEIDIFFAGTVDGFPVRERALAELTVLRNEGYVIDIADSRMPRAEFYRRCARAWLTLSPEGHGWDCFRHYEAAACGSVPLINQPTIRRYAPLIQGEHAVFFEVEPGFLGRRAREALADKARLSAIAEAGRAHVLANHTHEAVLRYVLQTMLPATQTSSKGLSG